MPAIPQKLSVLNLGVTRYSRPLSATHRLKFERLAELAEFHVVGLSSSLRPARFRDGATFLLVPLLPLAIVRFSLVVSFAFLLGLTSRFDLVLCESPYEGLAGVLLRGLLRLFGRRVVVVTELHGDWEVSPFLYRKVRFRSSVAPLLKRWSDFALRRSDLVRAVSQSLKIKAEKSGVTSVAAVFPTFTDFDLFLEPRERVPRDPPTVLYVGGLYPIKGINTLAEAFGKLVREGVRARLVVVGDGPYRDGLDSAEVTFRGAVPQSEVRREMLNARLLVLPSLSEGLPRVVMEAMASSLPVVATAVGGIPELVDDGVTGFLVPPGDASELARRMGELLEDEPAARRMGSRGREKAERDLSSARYFEGYRQLFEKAEDLLAGRSSE